ncbi:inositol monophosphatase [Ensifer adhaerens]|uniref:inositol monophosphatase family protein n=1 Tax=Ensifer adhaerens TaxID=106592 RepID=UPI001CC09D23|nr:inositol monophosphatase family protein [Ensifer adhaerens]MBZ7924975.1 inositol monophosphatase [Ensifer adhaerens]UAX95818.1 inositol monophosphatase [Ensifer adhaerens]UAY04841.1 inositol monophosphatase [Ensifer adhaerens]UAY10273.1 inositol monophosphatase [Ensifer adhaerens]
MIERDTMTTVGPDIAGIIEGIARKAGELALDHFRSLSTLPVQAKGHLDLVTIADQQLEEFLIAKLREAFPEDGVLGEESGEILGTSGRIWVIDPIDGTFNFVRGGQNWAISIGLFENNRPSFGVIHAPLRDLTLVGGKSVPTMLNGKPIRPLPALDMSRASTGFSFHPSASTEDRLEVIRFLSDELQISFRLCGAATLSLVEVAMGETDGYLSLGDSTWDVMAALPILANLGVSATIDWDRTDLSSKLRFACGNADFLDKVQPLLARIAKAA